MNTLQTQVDTFCQLIFGQREGFVALAFGRNPYRTEKGRYAHHDWCEQQYPWPSGREQMVADLASGVPTDVYVCPALRVTPDRRKGSAAPLTWLWVDLDAAPGDAALWRKLEPLTVASGQPGHRHAYILLTRAVDLATHALLNKALADRLGGDAKWSDESLLRLPGTLNFKPTVPINGAAPQPPAPVAIELGWSGTTWDPDELAGLLGVDSHAPQAGPAAVTVVEGEEVDFEALPTAIADRLAEESPADRSAAFHALVGACRAAGLSQGQTVTIMADWQPGLAKYGAKVPSEVARCWGKVAPGEAERWGELGERFYARWPAQQAAAATNGAVGAGHAVANGYLTGAAPTDGRIVAPAVSKGTWEQQTPQWQAFENEFWTARLELTYIRDFALARRCSPWAVLGNVLARVIAATPSRVVLPPLIGGRASLNLFVALVSESGGGKSGAMAVAPQAVDLGLLGGVMSYDSGQTVAFTEPTPGSGQGIAHVYLEWEKGVGMKPSAESALFKLEEIDHLSGLTGQTGSTLAPELRRLYMGEKLGHHYVDVHKRAEVAAHRYRACLVAGVQDARAGVLLDDTDGGTPQRWVWLPAIHPHADKRPPLPLAWPWKRPTWVPDPTDPAVTREAAPAELAAPVYAPVLPGAPGAASSAGAYAPVLPVAPVNPPRRWVTLPVAANAANAIDVAHLARSRGLGDPLDGHRLLCQEKVAAALGILAGRAEVSEADWDLAARVMAVSDRTRGQVVATLRAKAEGRNVAQARFEGVRATVVEDVKEQAAVQRAAQSVLRILGAAGDWLPRKALRDKLAGRDKAHLDAALEHLIAAGQVVSEEVPGRGQTGTRYRLPGVPA